MFDHALNYFSHLTVSFQDNKSMAPVNSDLRSFCQDGTQISTNWSEGGYARADAKKLNAQLIAKVGRFGRSQGGRLFCNGAASS